LVADGGSERAQKGGRGAGSELGHGVGGEFGRWLADAGAEILELTGHGAGAGELSQAGRERGRGTRGRSRASSAAGGPRAIPSPSPVRQDVAAGAQYCRCDWLSLGST
jgi:hypothetical protein